MKSSSLGGMVKRVLVSVFLCANIVFLLLLWGCCAITWIDSSLCPRLAVLCLAFPIILVLNLIFVPFWLVFKFRFLPIPIVGVLLCIGFILDYCPLHSQEQPVEEEGLTVMTWNIMSLSYKDLKERQDELLAYFDSVNADIVCLQECGREKLADTLKQHMTALGYNWTEQKGRTLYSRFPIVSEDTLRTETFKVNGVNVYKLLMGEGDTLVVMNAHLESNYLTKEDKYDGKAALLSANEEDMKKEGNNIFAKLADSHRMRGKQVGVITEALDGSFANTSTILCGDFNDTPISYAYQQVKQRLDNAYRNKGCGVSVSYNEQYFFVRIDHLFHSSDWETLSAHVDDAFLASDHYPLIVKLRRRTAKLP